MSHLRNVLSEAIESALAGAARTVESTDAVQAEDVPCVVFEEREETITRFDERLEFRASTLRRRYRFAVFAFGQSRKERDDIAGLVEQAVVPAAAGVNFKCTLVGVGFTRSALGTAARAYVAAQYYDAEYFTPSYWPDPPA